MRRISPRQHYGEYRGREERERLEKIPRGAIRATGGARQGLRLALAVADVPLQTALRAAERGGNEYRDEPETDGPCQNLQFNGQYQILRLVNC